MFVLFIKTNGHCQEMTVKFKENQSVKPKVSGDRAGGANPVVEEAGCLRLRSQCDKGALVFQGCDTGPGGFGALGDEVLGEKGDLLG